MIYRKQHSDLLRSRCCLGITPTYDVHILLSEIVFNTGGTFTEQGTTITLCYGFLNPSIVLYYCAFPWLCWCWKKKRKKTAECYRVLPKKYLLQRCMMYEYNAQHAFLHPTQHITYAHSTRAAFRANLYIAQYPRTPLTVMVMVGLIAFIQSLVWGTFVGARCCRARCPFVRSSAESDCPATEARVRCCGIGYNNTRDGGEDAATR